MTAELPRAVDRAVAANERFETTDGGVPTYTGTRFDATLDAEAGEGERDAEITVEIRLPTLSTVVDGEVADVVEDGWYDTLALRLEDTFGVATTSTHEEPVVERRDGEVLVTLEYVAWNAREGVDDAGSLVDFVEGTYVQGVIPGYDYLDPVADLVQQATQNAGADDDGSSRGGTPL